MDGYENRDCIIYDGKRVALGLRKPRAYYFKRMMAFAITVTALVLVGAVIGIAALHGDIMRAIGELVPSGGDGDVIGEGTEGEVSEGEHNSEGLIPILPEGDEDGEESEGSEGDAVSSPEIEPDKPTAPTATDLSFAELGDGYLINYSKLNPDADGILEMGFLGGRYAYSEAPLVLILHTHTSEGYWDMGEEPMHILTRSVVAVGERVSYELNRSGVPTVHCTVIHDGEGNAYENAAETIDTMLKIYPSIEYVIDLHRAEEVDGTGGVLKSVAADGSAQIRLTVSSEGVLTKDTLALALCLRRELNLGDRRLCMPVVFTDSEYNSGMSAYYLKVEVGCFGNDADEAIAAGESFAKALADILKK